VRRLSAEVACYFLAHMRLPYLRPGLRSLIGALAIAGAAGCGDELDDRPATREYIVTAILAPSCANAGCHSSSTAKAGYSFGTQKEAAEALDRLVLPGDVLRSRLAQVLRTDGEYRMPLDSPLPEADIALIETWILGGAE
jgi:hypothetical protein